MNVIKILEITMIPKVLFQTARFPVKQYVLDMIQSYLEDWEYKYFSDNDIIHFFHTNKLKDFPDIISRFYALKHGQHRADLFRYYYLFVKGGMYMDSDAMLYKNISEIVKDYDFISVKSSVIPNSIFQGIIGCTPNHPIIETALRRAYNTPPNKLEDYHFFCKELYQITQGYEGVHLLGEERKGNHDNIYDNDIVFRHYPLTKIIPFKPLFVDKIYTWGSHYIIFFCNGRMKAFGDGTYEIIDKHIIKATFGSCVHIITFSPDFTYFTSVRGDFEVISGFYVKPFLENSLFISYSTPNYSPLTDIYLNTLKKIDAKVDHYLDNITFNDEGFQTKSWYHCVNEKIKHLVNVLEQPHECKYFVFSDCDVTYAPNKKYWNHLEYYILTSPQSIFFMREGTGNDVNTGFFIIKNENLSKTIAFFQHICSLFLKTPKNQMPFGDQTLINNHKNMIDYDFIPGEYVIWGRSVGNKKKTLLHHAVGCGDIASKLKQIEEINLFGKNS